MTIDTPALPAGYEWGFVVGQIIEAIADQAGDADRFPESRPMTGTVRFEPLVEMQTVTTPTPAFVAHKKVTVNLNDDGELIDADGLPGVWLVTGVYRVSFQLVDATIPAFSIEVLATHTIVAPLDLPLQAPYVAPPGTSVQTLVVPSGLTEGDVLIKTGTTITGAPQSTFSGTDGRDMIVIGTDPPEDEAVLWLDEEADGNPITGSPFELRGVGSPEGVVVAGPGVYYTDSAGTNGAWRWIKTSGVGNTGWSVYYGKTFRIVYGPWSPGFSSYENKLLLSRVGDLVTLESMAVGVNTGAVGYDGTAYILPLGFRGPGNLGGVNLNGSGLSMAWTADRLIKGSAALTSLYISWLTRDPWPTTLPGTAV